MSMPHAVQFYHDDVFLIEAVCSFIKAGAEEGAANIVVATEQHREELRNTLQGTGIPGIEDKVVYFDVVELLSASWWMNWPNHTRFTATWGHRATGRSGRSRPLSVKWSRAVGERPDASRHSLE